MPGSRPCACFFLLRVDLPCSDLARLSLLVGLEVGTADDRPEAFGNDRVGALHVASDAKRRRQVLKGGNPYEIGDASHQEPGDSRGRNLGFNTDLPGTGCGRESTS